MFSYLIATVFLAGVAFTYQCFLDQVLPTKQDIPDNTPHQTIEE